MQPLQYIVEGLIIESLTEISLTKIVSNSHIQSSPNRQKS